MANFATALKTVVSKRFSYFYITYKLSTKKRNRPDEGIKPSAEWRGEKWRLRNAQRAGTTSLCWFSQREIRWIFLYSAKREWKEKKTHWVQYSGTHVGSWHSAYIDVQVKCWRGCSLALGRREWAPELLHLIKSLSLNGIKWSIVQNEKKIDCKIIKNNSKRWLKVYEKFETKAFSWFFQLVILNTKFVPSSSNNKRQTLSLYCNRECWPAPDVWPFPPHSHVSFLFPPPFSSSRQYSRSIVRVFFAVPYSLSLFLPPMFSFSSFERHTGVNSCVERRFINTILVLHTIIDA